MKAYMRVYADLLEKIRNNTYPHGSFLPPEPELERIYGVSRTTVRRAISLLVNEKSVYVKQGRGTEVIAKRGVYEEKQYRFSNITHVTEQLSRTERPTHTQMCIDKTPAFSEIAAFFKLKSGTEVYRIRRAVKYTDGVAVGYKVNYLPIRNFEGLEQYNSVAINVYTLILNQYGIKPDNIYEIVTAVVANFEDSHVLNVKVGDPLLLLRRYSYSAERPIEYCEFKIIPKHYELGIHMEETTT